MEHQKKNCQTTHQISQLNLEQKIGMKQMVNHVECITLIVKLNLKLQCQGQGETLTITEAGDDDAAR